MWLAKSSILKKGKLLLQIITNIVKRLGSPSLIYILRTTSRYNINAPSSSKTKHLSAEAHLHTRYPKHCILVNDFTFQLKKIFQHYLQSIFSAPTRSPDGFHRHGALREIFSNVFRYTSPTLPEGIGSNSVENPRPSVCAIKMAPMFKIKKRKTKFSSSSASSFASFSTSSLACYRRFLHFFHSAVQMYTRPDAPDSTS